RGHNRCANVLTVRLDILGCDAVKALPVFSAPITLVNEAFVERNDLPPRAVIDVERDLTRFTPEILPAAFGKLDEIFDAGCAETIEGLVVVTDDAKVLGAARQLEEEKFLNSIRVLILVNDDVFEYPARTVHIIEGFERALLQEGEINLILKRQLRLVT